MMSNFSESEAEKITAVLTDLAEFRRNTGARVAEWEKKGGKNEGSELVILLAAVLTEADGLSRLIDSIVDGTEESVPVEDLRERVVGLKLRAGILIGRWKAFRAQGIER